MHDPYNLRRFVDAQERVYGQVLEELAAGEKRTHWMWFIFPQIQGLGHSPIAQRFAISGRAEATAYAEHSVLGPRLRECTKLVIAVQGRSIEQVFGYPDHLKFRSSMTLFMACAADNAILREALDKYFGGAPDELTVAALDTLQPRRPPRGPAPA